MEIGRPKIRRFDPSADLNSVIKLNRVFLPENYPSYFFLENYKRCPEGFLVAEVDGKIIGYIMCRVEIAFTGDETIKMGHVLSVAVDKDYRRRGIGTRLMLQAEENLTRDRGVDLMYLEVRVSNEPAISLYKKLGYSILGVISRYYADGEDAYLMYKPTSEAATLSRVKETLGRRVRQVN